MELLIRAEWEGWKCFQLHGYNRTTDGKHPFKLCAALILTGYLQPLHICGGRYRNGLACRPGLGHAVSFNGVEQARPFRGEFCLAKN